MKTTRFLTTLAVLAATTLQLHAEYRIWTSADGVRKFQAQLVSSENGKVQLRRTNGRVVTFDTKLLSPADQKFLASSSPGKTTGSTATTSAGGGWPGWRGADRTDHSPDTGLLKKWPSAGPGKSWMFENAGAGYSGPSIVAGTLYTLGIRDDVEEVVMALDIATGEEKWATTIGDRYTNNWGDGPRSTPTVSDGHLYVLGAKGNLACLDAGSGKKVWDKSLTDDFGGKVNNWGYTESPLVLGDLVITTPGGGDGTVLALDKKTGKKKWQSKDITDKADYSSCITFEFGGKTQIAQLTAKHVFGLDAENGDLLWQHDWDGRTAVIPTPVYKDGHVYIACGYGVGCMLVKLPESGKGEVTQVYRNKTMVNHHGGVILVGDHLYGYSDGGGWVCQDFMTGEQVWGEKDALKKGAIHYADGHLYCLEENSGTVVLAEASPDGWKEKSRFTLDPQTEIRKSSGKIWTHPVVLDGKLYLRDQDLIYCYDVKG